MAPYTRTRSRAKRRLDGLMRSRPEQSTQGPSNRTTLTEASTRQRAPEHRESVALRGRYSPVTVVRLCANSLIGRKVVSGKVVELGSGSQLRHCRRVGRYTGGTCRSAQPAFPYRPLLCRPESPSGPAGRTASTATTWIPACPLPGSTNGSILGGSRWYP